MIKNCYCKYIRGLAVRYEFTFQDRHIDDTKLAVYLENQGSGDYFIDYYLATDVIGV
jgi:hypothetical protein